MLEQRLANVLDAIENGMVWTSDQMPLVIKELFTWKTFEYSAWTIIGVILLIVGIKLAKKGIKEAEGGGFLGDGLGWKLSGYGGISMGIIVVILHLYLLMQMNVAPKLYLIEYLGRIVSN